MKKTIFALIICLCCLNSVFAFKYSNTPAGMIYFASHGYVENNEVLNNPYIIGGLYTMHCRSKVSIIGKRWMIL